MKTEKPIFINNNSKVGILMLHGFSSAPRQFEKLAVYLSEKGYNISAPVIAGHGTSPEDFINTSPKDWTKSVMDAYAELKKISDKIFIVGNSFGANLGMWLLKELNNEPAGIVVLGAPIYLRFHNLIKLRLFTYGRFMKYYKKPFRFFKRKPKSVVDNIAYPFLPIKNVVEFISFVEKETKPNLQKIKVPILIASASFDPLVHPKSVEYIFNNVGSSIREIFWFNYKKHDIVGGGNEDLFSKIYEFIKGIK